MMAGRKSLTKLILVCGLPGTGKTTVAEAIAKKAKARLLSTDVIRKEMISRPSYGKHEKDMVYGLLFSMAEMMLRDGKSVLLDGTFYRADLRKRAGEIAAKTKSEFRVVEVVCDEEKIRQRLDKRCSAACASCASDADFAVYQKIKKIFEPISGKHAVIDTGKDWEKQIGAFAREIDGS